MKRAVFWLMAAVYTAGIALIVCSYIIGENVVSLNLRQWRANVMRPKKASALAQGNYLSPNHVAEDPETNKEWRSTEESNTTNATSCQPRHRFVFIKTHKTGSSTIATTIHRYGYSRNLNFALPKNSHTFSQFLKFNSSDVYGWDLRDNNGSLVMPGMGGYDIFSCHGRYNRAAMDAVIPNAIYFTILREPAAQFESAFDFYHISRYVPHHSITGVFEKDPKSFSKSNNSQPMSFMRNGQIYDLGLEQELQDPKSVDDKIKSLSEEIDLVMIKEYFDESLILLKKLLCWDFDDIVYISKLVRLSSVRQTITTDLKNKIEKWNYADVKLYQHFNKTFWDKIRKFGSGFQRELQTFRKIKMETTAKCLKGAKVTIDSHKISSYKVTSNSNRKCEDLIRSEMSWVKVLRKHLTKKIFSLFSIP